MSRIRYLLTALLVACAGPAPAPDASVDPREDAALDPIDGDSPFDADPPFDAGSRSDAGPPDLPDTGPPTCSSPRTWYRDLDGDRHGDPSASVESCDPVEGFVTSDDDCDDACGDCFPGAVERCDGRDDDCNGAADEVFACVVGAPVACTTSCGTMGMGTCTDACAPPSGTACAPPAETCNALDDDCDGAADDGFDCASGSAVACATSCGSTGSGTCTASCGLPAPSECAPPAETCNGLDDDCDGAVDQSFACALGERVACTTSCGTEGTGDCTATCDIPSGASCEPPAETCNGRDDDCDGTADQTFTCAAGRTASCTTTCGSTGRGTCTSTCDPAAPAACAPPSETCTYADDDCDGLIDENVMVAGPPLVATDYYNFARPRVARSSSVLWGVWRTGPNNYLFRTSLDGTGTRRVGLPSTDAYDLGASSSGTIYAYVNAGVVHVQRLSTDPIGGTSPFRWSRTLDDASASEVYLAVGSTYLWVYVRTESGRVSYYTLRTDTGALVSDPHFVANTPFRIAVSSNGYREHLVAFLGGNFIFWFVYDMTEGLQDSGVFEIDPVRLRDLAIAGDYRPATSRQGVLIAYSLAESTSGAPAELRYHSSRPGLTDVDGRIALGTSADTRFPGLDLEMADGIALLGAVWTSSDATTGQPRAYELAARPASGAYTTHAISLGLGSAYHEGISVIRYPDSAGAIPDRLFYNPPVNGTASIPIGCF